MTEQQRSQLVHKIVDKLGHSVNELDLKNKQIPQLMTALLTMLAITMHQTMDTKTKSDRKELIDIATKELERLLTEIVDQHKPKTH